VASIQRIVSPRTQEVTYRVQVRPNGREPESATFPNLKEAKAWAISVEAAIREARHFPYVRRCEQVSMRWRRTMPRPCSLSSREGACYARASSGLVVEAVLGTNAGRSYSGPNLQGARSARDRDCLRAK